MRQRTLASHNRLGHGQYWELRVDGMALETAPVVALDLPAVPFQVAGMAAPEGEEVSSQAAYLMDRGGCAGMTSTWMSLHYCSSFDAPCRLWFV